MAETRKKILSVLLGCSLLFGTIFANAVSIEFEDIGTDDACITYEELETEDTTTEENLIQNINSPLATETSSVEEITIEPEIVEFDSAIQNYALRSSTPFDITLTPNTNGYGSVSLDWSEYDYKDKNFKVYKSSDGGVTYETIGIDYTLVNEVKCLQIYPISNASNQLKTWMEINGYGKGIIKIDSVYIDTFNANPDAYLKDASGNYKYDVIFFGTWDGNNSKDLTAISAKAVESYINSGRGCIFGHDTLRFGTNPNFNSLASITSSKSMCKSHTEISSILYVQ